MREGLQGTAHRLLDPTASEGLQHFAPYYVTMRLQHPEYIAHLT
jgi:hypothetical protein